MVAVADGAADIRNTLDKAVVGNKRVGPDRLDQDVLADNDTRVFQQFRQNLRALAAQGLALVVKVLQLKPFRVEQEVTNSKDFRRFQRFFGVGSGHFSTPNALLT